MFNLPFRPVHIIEHLLNHVKEQADDIKPLGLRVAYQQPCASRYTPWKDKQLDELLGLIGVERVERGPCPPYRSRVSKGKAQLLQPAPACAAY